MRETTFEQFTALAREASFVPVVKEIPADLLTPVSAFLKIAGHSDHAFLFESVEGGERVARYSFLGKDPFLVLRARDGGTTVEEGGARRVEDAPFLEVLRELVERYRAPAVPGLPRFIGGAVGYLGYDAAPWFEPALARAWNEHYGGAAEPGQAGGEGSVPSDDVAGFMAFDTVLAFDHLLHRILLIASARIDEDDDLRGLYDFARARIRFLECELERTLSEPTPNRARAPSVRALTERTAFESAVREVQRHIAAGDVYQAVLSQAFEADVIVDPFTVYRALRHVNPSPYMYFLRMDDVSVVGSSPEMLLRVEGSDVETHPIAGTRARGGSDDEDRRLARELEGDEKERAEHVMLVDLGRNDLGRVCAYGTVEVPRFMDVERYSHVMHLVSRVTGRLEDGLDRLDALAACFPAGTVSGAPKIRAMEIIARLEGRRRGLYAGAVGYLDFAGNLDCCIAIRTIVLRNGRATVRAGAGIVADSDPAAEYEETRDKARGLLQALELAQTEWR